MIRKINEAERAQLQRRFSSGKPFPHLVIENFLTEHRSLLKGLKKEKFEAKDSDLFSFAQTKNLYFSSVAEVKKAVKMFSSNEFAQLIGSITSTKLKAGAVDLFGALYRKTDYLLCHDDKLEGRKIAFILYLSKSFRKNDGGALTLVSSKGSHPGRKMVAYPPLENSLAMFKVSRKSWHEVEEVMSDKKRYTIGGWLH